jgi:hypothetical protein
VKKVNNWAENKHEPMCERERRMHGFRVPELTQAFSSSFESIQQQFSLKRHLRARRSTANNSVNALPHGIVSPSLPKIRRALRKGRSIALRRKHFNVTTLSERLSLSFL